MKLLIIASCSLIISYDCAYGEETKKTQASSVSYSSGKAPIKPDTTRALVDSRRLKDLAASASSPSHAVAGYAFAQTQQPSIYHSIIDRTSSSNRLASPVQATTATVGDLNMAAGHHHGHAHGKYYEYREVPKKKTWKFGYKRGNHKHTIERHEHGKAGKHPHFKTKVKWHDKKSKGKGIHLWDYNHHDKKHYHHG